jgi:hypothetical protein
VKVVRVKNRVYDNGRLASHAEYAIVSGEQPIAHIVFNRRAWIVVQRSNEQSFGKAISPINLKLLRDVKQWAIAKWERNTSK